MPAIAKSEALVITVDGSNGLKGHKTNGDVKANLSTLKDLSTLGGKGLGKGSSEMCIRSCRGITISEYL